MPKPSPTIEKLLEEHSRWAETDGRQGKPADLTGKDLRHIPQLSQYKLTALIAPQALLYGVNLEGTSLQGSNLAGCDLRSAKLGGADLRGVNLSGALLNHADLRDAKLGPLDDFRADGFCRPVSTMPRRAMPICAAPICAGRGCRAAICPMPIWAMPTCATRKSRARISQAPNCPDVLRKPWPHRPVEAGTEAKPPAPRSWRG